jgi:hypothetical protein
MVYSTLYTIYRMVDDVSCIAFSCFIAARTIHCILYAVVYTPSGKVRNIHDKLFRISNEFSYYTYCIFKWSLRSSLAFEENLSILSGTLRCGSVHTNLNVVMSELKKIK